MCQVIEGDLTVDGRRKVTLVNIPRSTIDSLMEDLGPHGWTRKQVYDYSLHEWMKVPRYDGCETCPTPVGPLTLENLDPSSWDFANDSN